ncbi:MAG TPA: hypothetical protein VII13_19550 [Vicinamibacteria bacterium]|jgi:hypothetical protein
MKIRLLCCPAVLAGLTAACSGSARDTAAPPASTAAAPVADAGGATTPPAAVREMAIEAVALGRSLAPDGTVAEAASSFKRGDPVFVSVKTTPISPGTEVRLVFFGPRGEQVGEEKLVVPPAATAVNLRAKDTSAWSTGTHRLEIWLGGAKAGEESFEIS